MKRWLWLALLLLPCAMHAQVVGPGFINYVTSVPSGTCSQGEQMRVVIGLGTVYTCQSGTWAQIGGAASAPTWDAILSPVGNQTLTMTGFSTTWNWGSTNTNKFAFDTTGNPTFGLVNSTTAVTNSPTITISGSYQNAGTPTFIADTWTIQDIIAAGTNGRTDLTFTHANSGGIRSVNFNTNSSTTPSITFGNTAAQTGLGQDGSNSLSLYANGLGFSVFGTTGVSIGSSARYAMTNGAANATIDTGISRDAAAVVDVGNGTAGDTTGKLKAAGYMSVGTKFTTDTGCGTVTTLLGGATAGSFVAQATGACTVVITMGNTATAPNGWACTVNDRTTANLFRQTASSATTCTISGTAVTSDVISFSAIGY